MTTPFRIGPQQVPGGDIAKVLAIVNKNMRDLRRDVVRLPVVLDIPEDIQSNYGTTNDMTMISTTLIGGVISPPARGVRLEAWGQVQNHSGATATVEIHAMFGTTTASVVTATLDDIGASTTIRHLTYALDITRARTFVDSASAGQDGVRFDGTYDYARRGADLTGNADSPRGIISLWFKRKAITSSQRVWGSQLPASSSQSFFIEFDAGSVETNDKIRIFGANGATVLDAHTTATTDMASWHHFLASWDLSGTLTLNMYLDDVRTSSSVTTILTSTIDYSDATYDHYVGAYHPATGAERLLNAEISELYVNYSEFLDFTVVANRRLFNDGAGNPVDLGANGQTPTGNAPLVHAPDGDPRRNKGIGGGFSLFGNLDGIPGPVPAPSSADTGQVYRSQLQVSNVTVNAPGPAEDTLIDRKTFYTTTSGPDIEADQIIRVIGRNSVARASTGIELFRARVDLI